MKKKIFYATKNHDGEVINKYAKIVKFDSYIKMKEFLLSQFTTDDKKNAQIKTMEFAEFWFESYNPIHVGNQYIYEPFSYNQLKVDKFPPSGKKSIWVTPRHVDVYVAELIYED